MDVLLLPTAGTIYTHEEVAADPVQLNTNLGYYTNFVNLLDLAAVAAPGGHSRERTPVRRVVDRPGVQRRSAAGGGRSLPSRAGAGARR